MRIKVIFKDLPIKKYRQLEKANLGELSFIDTQAVKNKKPVLVYLYLEGTYREAGEKLKTISKILKK